MIVSFPQCGHGISQKPSPSAHERAANPCGTDLLCDSFSPTSHSRVSSEITVRGINEPTTHQSQLLSARYVSSATRLTTIVKTIYETLCKNTSWIILINRWIIKDSPRI